VALVGVGNRAVPHAHAPEIVSFGVTFVSSTEEDFMRFQRLPAILTVCLLALWGGAGCATTAKPPRAYPTPEAAAGALADAARSGSDAQLKGVLGSDAGAIVSSGDPVADDANREAFVEAYDARHEIETGPDGRATLVVGEGRWPMPIPLVHGKKGWTFDAEQGKDEILTRRIGRNELDAIEVCRAIVDAENEYAERRIDGIPQYAQKFKSDPGKKDGLYWEVPDGESESPLGPLVATAADEGYVASKDSEPTAYHGYRYRILKSQGPHAKGGAQDYVVDGKMIGGFALVAYPAEYGNSGVMTFVTNYEGVVYQCDLGEDTHTVASKMTTFDPSDSWTVVPAATGEAAGTEK
jgi:hypothetical protein